MPVGVRPIIISLSLGAALAVATVRVAVAATPAASPEDERLLYAFRFDGLRVGDVLIALHETDTAYNGELDGLSKGLLRLFGDFRTDVSGQGHVGETDSVRLEPNIFRRAWAMGHSGSVMTVAFDPATHVAASTERLFNPSTGAELPPDRRDRKRAPLAEEKRTGVLDPMTAVIAARDRIRRSWSDGGAPGPAFRLPVFDGRHRYDVVVTPGAVATERIAGRPRRVVPVTTQIEPAAGFENSMAKHARQSTGRVIFSADEDFIPLEVVAGNALGKGVFTLIADCHSNPTPCDALSEKSQITGTP